MAATRSKLVQASATLPACRAQVVFSFADGWTVRTPQTLGDTHREGC